MIASSRGEAEKRERGYVSCGKRERRRDGAREKRRRGGKSIERGSRTRRFENEGAKVSAIKLCLYEVGTGCSGRGDRSRGNGIRNRLIHGRNQKMPT